MKNINKFRYERRVYLLPTLFNIYIDDGIWKWKEKAPTGVQITDNKYIFYVANVLIQNSENNLHKSVHFLNFTD